MEFTIIHFVWLKEERKSLNNIIRFLFFIFFVRKVCPVVEFYLRIMHNGAKENTQH